MSDLACSVLRIFVCLLFSVFYFSINVYLVFYNFVGFIFIYVFSIQL